MLTGPDSPSAGEVEVAGCVPFRRQAGFLRQIHPGDGARKPQLIWDLPPLDSLRVNAAVYGIDDSEANAASTSWPACSIWARSSPPVRQALARASG